MVAIPEAPKSADDLSYHPSTVPPPDGHAAGGQRWRRSGILLGTILTAAFVGLGILLSMAPEFYARRVAPLDHAEQRTLSREFLKGGSQVVNDIRLESKWSADFQERQINAWLAEDFEANHAEQSLPPGVSRPRLMMDGDTLRVGFMYRRWLFSTVVHAGVRLWVPKRHVLAMELDGAWAGRMPLPDSQLRRIVENLAYGNNLEVTWKRNGSKLVALLEFPRDYREIILQRLEISDGRIHVSGIRARASYSGGDFAPAAN